MAGIAGVVVIGAVAAKLAMSGERGAVSDTTAKPASPTVQAPVQNTPVTQQATDKMAKQVAPTARSLDQLENDASVTSKVEGVLTALSAYPAANDDEKARVNFIRFKAYTSRQDADKACIAIKEAMKLVQDPIARDKYQTRAEGCS
jgi:hypothetical protein